MEQKQEGIIAALTFRPYEGLHYRIKAGQITKYSLSYASGSLTNEFENQDSGLVWGVGARWNVSQNTMVSSAVSLDLSYTQTLVSIDRFKSGGTLTPVSQSIKQDEIQGAVTLSHRFKWIEPFGGLKVSQVKTTLKDKSTQEQLKGTQEMFSPFIGVEIEMFKNEKFIIEASFVDEKSVSAGINLNF